MGMYTYLSKNDVENYSKLSSKYINEIFQEVQELMPHILISERINESMSFFGKKTIKTTFTIYHIVDKNITDYCEVRCMNIDLSSEALLFNYLCGLLNGYNYLKSKNINDERKK